MLRNEPGWLLHNCAAIFHTFFLIFLALSTLSDAKSASFTNTVLNDGATENIFAEPQTPLAESLKSSYDYIIVGAGSAGSVLAARLSEDPSRTVLLVEAGPDDRGRPELTTPISGFSTLGTDLDWAYTTEPDIKYRGLDRNRNILRGGKVLGGSSSINIMVYCRGSRNDFDRWAQYTGDEAWGYRHVLSYFKKLENAQGSLKDSPYRGTSGPLTITQRTTVSFPDFFIRASEEAGYSRNRDYNGEKMLGSGYLQHMALNGERMSASRAYLWRVLERSNLDVVVNTQVSHVLIKNGRAVGVHLIQGQGQGKGDSTTLTLNVEAKAEVISSAGAVGSPKLLMLSGVGPRNHLESLGIPVVADLPVGENFQDHLSIDLSYKIDKPIGLNRLSLQDPKVLEEYLTKRTGPLSSPYGTESVLFTADSEYDCLKDWPTIQLMAINAPSGSNVMKQHNYLKQSILELAGRDKITDGFMIFATLLRPKSRGRITLKSKDPLDSPRIKTNYLSRVEDIDTLMESINVTQNVVNTMSLKSVGSAPTEEFTYTPCKQYRYDTREFWECQVQSRPLSIWHPVGTCKMGPQGDKTAVVDSQLRVQGIQGLRVVDASIMPWITSCNTNAPVIMIAEKAADIIKGVKPLEPTDTDKAK